MRKIKFKTEYVPLSDDVINRHKNFDQLMGAYVAAPKPNWFKKFIQKKWTMFGGGLMTGAIITSLLWYSQDVTMVNQPVAEQAKPMHEIQEATKNNTAAIFDSSVSNSRDVAITNEAIDQGMASVDVDAESAAKVVENTTSEKSTSSNKSANANASSKFPDLNYGGNKETNSIAASQDDARLDVEEMNNESENLAVAPVTIEEITTESVSIGNEMEESRSNTSDELSVEGKEETVVDVADFSIGTESNYNESANFIGPQEYFSVQDTSDQITVVEDDGKKNDVLLPGVVAGAAIITPSVDGPSIPSTNSKKDKKNNEQLKKEKDSSAIAFPGLSLFKRDTSKNAAENNEKKGWFVFGKDSTEENLSANSSKDSSIEMKSSVHNVNQDSLYTPRYAQVSFITPLSSNGIDGYKYMHYVSLNVLQGYNGAVKGAEFGGLLNGVKGYVTGAQFAGLGNYAGGNLKGAQFGGLANVSESVMGAQFAGITNVSGSFVSGFQAAGVVNVSPDSLNGLQIAGVVNVLSSEKKSQSWQVAGVGNVSLAQSKGGQIGGVFNVANQLFGGQIGLINFGKSIKGFQIGLINISDTIDGVPIGLISVSSTGIFDANIWTSDFLAINGGIRVGSKYVYNIYAYGVSPFNDDLPFGFGIGIGGHIPIKKRAFIDIDGMAWSMHHSYISFSEINMINQLRVMGGFTINKYLSFFAGPTFNVSVQDNRYDPFLNNYFYENVSENTTVRLAPGFVAGIRVF